MALATVDTPVSTRCSHCGNWHLSNNADLDNPISFCSDECADAFNMKEMKFNSSIPPSTMNIQELAKTASDCFERIKRKNDDEKEIYITKHESPEWVKHLCHDAHGDMLPDDYRYEFIVEALDAICDHDDLDEARDSLEPDIYNSDLTAWLGSNNYRLSYVNDATQEFGNSPANIIGDLQHGQLLEKYEVFDSVVNSLEDHLSENFQ